MCILPCPQNSEQRFSINREIPSGCQRGRWKCNILILPAWCLEPCSSFSYDFGPTYVCVMFVHAVPVNLFLRLQFHSICNNVLWGFICSSSILLHDSSFLYNGEIVHFKTSQKIEQVLQQKEYREYKFGTQVSTFLQFASNCLTFCLHKFRMGFHVAFLLSVFGRRKCH